MCLHTYGINADSPFLQVFHQFHHCCSSARICHWVIIVIQLRIRIGFMCILKSQRNILFSQNLIKFTLTISSVVFNRLIYHIPSLNTTFIPFHDSSDMLFHPLFQNIRRDIPPFLINTKPRSQLRMPNQTMTDNKHPVLFTETDKFVRLNKVIPILFRMN